MKKTVNWNFIWTTIIGIGYTKERKPFGMDWMIILPFMAIMWQWNSKKHREMMKTMAEAKEKKEKEMEEAKNGEEEG